MRYKSQPFLGPASRCSAPLYRRASGLCLCGTLLCRHCSAQFSTIQCYARAKLFFADADPFKAFTPLCQSMPLQVRSVLSRTIPLPCLATLCPCPTVLFPCYALRSRAEPFPCFALLCQAMHCQNMTAQLSAFPFPCFSVQCYAQAFRCYALPLNCHHNAMPCLSSSPQCIAVPSPRIAVLCLCVTTPLYAMPCQNISMLCLCGSSHDFAQAPLWYGLPVQVRS